MILIKTIHINQNFSLYKQLILLSKGHPVFLSYTKIIKNPLFLKMVLSESTKRHKTIKGKR